MVQCIVKPLIIVAILLPFTEDFSPTQYEMDARNRAIKELQAYIQRGQPSKYHGWTSSLIM